MNLEEVEKSITKDIDLLNKETGRLNDGWKKLRPIERILLVHTCFNELGIINREILDFGNTCLSEFPPVPNYLNDNWKKGIKSIKRNIEDIEEKIKKVDKVDRSLIREFLDKMDKVFLEKKKANSPLEIDKENDPGYKLQTANENIEDTECKMINMFITVCNQLNENLNQWYDKINAQDKDTLLANCQRKENNYLKYEWPIIETGIINEITNKSINEKDIEDNIKDYLKTKYNELLNDEIGRRFLETKMTNDDIVVILGDRDEQHSSDDLYKLFRYRHTKKLLQDKTNADFLNQRYQDENYEKEINSIMKKVSLGNEFFNIKLSQRALAELYFVTRNNILRWPEDVEDNERIEVSKMNMFFYLLQAFVDCREELKQKAKDSANPVQSNSYIGSQLVPNGELSDSVFCALIHQWFPNIKFDKEEYDARAFAQAISTERSKWNKNSLSNTFEDKKIILNKAKDHLLKLNLKFIRNNEKYFK